MPEDELQSLADDIKANALQVPIVVNEAGEILDGRRRALDCRRAGVEHGVRSSRVGCISQHQAAQSVGWAEGDIGSQGVEHGGDKAGAEGER